MDSKECSLLPLELCEEILCRVPTKSLIRFKLTCKRWLLLLENKRFIYKHLALLQQHLIMIDYHKAKIINPELESWSSFSLSLDFQCKPEIYTMIHCNGLLLCILDSSAIAVWNPCLNQVRWIKPNKYYHPNFCFHGIGYGDLSRDGYKIMRFINGLFTKNEYANSGAYNPEVDIYELKSGSWKTLNVSLNWHVLSPCRGVSLKGNMYWIAKWNRKSNFFIQSFDFSTGTFEPWSLPFEYDASDVVNLSVFRGDNLSLLHMIEETRKIEVWVTNEVEKGVIISWTKFFNVTSPDLPVWPACENLASPMHFIDKNNKIVVCCEELLADEKNVSVNIYLIGEGEIKKQLEIERHKRGFSSPFVSAYTYLPSLVPVPT